MSEELLVQESSGNVFQDIGLKNPEIYQAKAEIARQIGKLIEARGLSQQKAAEILGVDQPKVSALLHGRLSGFSYERLLKFLMRLNCEIQIVIKPRSTALGRLSVVGSHR